jgi:uncharacterized protein YbaR (Trm112 family)
MPGQNEDTLIRQELYCHNCGGYVQFDLDTAINGNHVLACPNCKHEHCRVVKDGKISDVRWDQRNGAQNGMQVYYIPTYSMTYTTASVITTTVNTAMYMYSASTGTGGITYY